MSGEFHRQRILAGYGPWGRKELDTTEYIQTASLYTNNELAEKVKKKKSPFRIISKIKYLRMNLSKELKDLYIENYKRIIKKTEGDSKKWKAILCSWIGRINIVKMAILPKEIYRFTQSQICR